MLLRTWLDITAGWHFAFCQHRSTCRALCQALGSLTTLGRRTLSRVIGSQGRQQQDWSADYRLHARARWRSDDLFQPVLEKALPFCRGRYLAVAVDDTRLHKTGRKILSAFYQRDPLSPKFRFNLMWGLRFLQMSLLVPLYRIGKYSPRGLPLRFEEVPSAEEALHQGASATVGCLAGSSKDLQPLYPNCGYSARAAFRLGRGRGRRQNSAGRL